ncbi:hypothetical protein YA5_001510 [Tetragenococcus halophilus]|uniref:Uncharacterized protein n=1 Tax=Tetragenococcus halophilus (strain DSM 20338 / JCM 20259 / NCIMB 9735 / NBRC 12172) TaxID=945021 RepID=A0AAN1SIW4_TETHN|nr:hypothetical protein TEH_23100 [Tetragenococcus halophilus NBRC 12172]GFK23079.1 hypothetical protein YA163_01420 [Tetragenococcus halophilus]GFK27709.1 hypothetical protein YG2_01430 [Tetragenococcus halophilus]GLL50180.1 hypothetical protein YA5_001510 [Tetragenococcus halophilus]GMA45097.1 hypothetical protein GCM10025853_25540 [Tetragenococcus halophilus subsp. halophilus DSM 20339]
MFRYIHPLTQKAKELLKHTSYRQKVYPKDRNLPFKVHIDHRQYKQIPQPTFNKNMLFYNTQR